MFLFYHVHRTQWRPKIIVFLALVQKSDIFGKERSERGSDKVTLWMCVEGEAVQK